MTFLGRGPSREGWQAPKVGTMQTLPQISRQRGPAPWRSWSCGREQASRKLAKMFVGAEACINILFNRGLWANTVYSGSVQREQLRPCGAGDGDAEQQGQSDLPWRSPGPGVLSTIAALAEGTGSPKTPLFPVPQLCSGGRLSPSCQWLRKLTAAMPCKTWFGSALLHSGWESFGCKPTAALPVGLQVVAP